MIFSDIMKEINEGSYYFDDKLHSVFKIEKNPVSIIFLPKKAVLIFKNGEEEEKINIDFTDFAKITFVAQEKEIEEAETKISLLYDGNEKFTKSGKTMENIVELFKKLTSLFTDNEKCSPYFQVKAAISEYNLNEESFYNKMLYRLLLLYKNKMDEIFNNEFLHPSSKILAVIEAESGKIADNFGATAKKNLTAKHLLSGGNILGNLATSAFNIAKAAGSRLLSSTVSEISGDKNIMILTDKNVILVTADMIDEYDFDEANETFSAQTDETLAGVVDIFDDSDSEILSNVSQKDWNVFKTTIRKLKKELETNPSVVENIQTDDEFSVIEAKLEKLKKLVEKGLLSQEDFEKKKIEILSEI